MKHELKLLTKLELCNVGKINEVLHGNEKKKKQMGMQLLAYIVMGIFLICISAKMSSAVCESGSPFNVPGLLMGFASVVILVITLFRAGEILFSYSTYERLITLPFKHFNIILSRFIHVYIEAFVLGLVIILPGMIAYAVYTSMTGVGWILTVLCLLFVPVIPVTIAALIDFAALSVTAKAKHRGIVSIIVSIVAMLALMVMMFLLTGKPENLVNIATQAGNIFSNIYPPVNWYAVSLTGDFLLFLLYVLVSIVIGLLLVMLFAKTFQKISSATQEHCVTPKFVMTEQSHVSLKKGLFKLEAKRLFGTRVYVLQSIIGHVIMVVGVIVLLIMAISLKTAGIFNDEVADFIEKFAFILPLIIVFLSCLTPTTSSAISIEGKQWWILKSLPIPMKSIARAKGKLNLALAVPCVLFASIIGCIISLLIGIDDILGLIMMFLFPLAAVWFCTYFNLFLNLKNPSLDWDNVTDAVKSGPVVLFSVLCCFGIVALGGVLCWLMGTLIGINSLGLVITSIILVILTVIIFKKIGKVNIRDIE